MSDRIKGLSVVFTKDIGGEYCQKIIDAILMIKGVENVTPSISDSDDWMNREQVKSELRKKIYSFFSEGLF